MVKLDHDVLIMRKNLKLPSSQYEKLSQDIKLEDVFDQFKHDKRYWNLYKFYKTARNDLEDLPFAHRPVFAVIQHLSKELPCL